MTTEPSKEAQFKQRFISVVADLQQNGIDDPEAMAHIGGLAVELSDALKQKSWVAVKQSMTPAIYDELLASFQKRGNEYHKDGRTKLAYAIQLLSVSLVAFTQRNDADIAAGEKLVDQLIDQAATRYRQVRPKH
ncbi:hypothetical protein [Devosia marina]|uniref:Uncharacterized protein n=1 Tax=Devosia marina TaxID=2683198 RepID=A0A7X3FQK3_9HYPH|nr:hypothetical protein [Devosia marina]MVS98770.1 hypothetical protein [Devosia marina]